MLFSPNLDGLQLLVDVCSEFAAKMILSSIVKNLLAYYLLHFGKKFYGMPTPQLTLNSNKIDFVESVKYLGVHIFNSLTNDDDIARQVRSLYCKANVLKHRFF